MGGDEQSIEMRVECSSLERLVMESVEFGATLIKALPPTSHMS